MIPTNACDFAKSFLRFTSSRIQNTARLELDALCTITDRKSNRSTRFALTAPCICENMYQEKDLIQVPTGEFRMIASEEEYRILKDYPSHDLDADIARRKDAVHPTFDGRTGRLTELVIHVAAAGAVREVRSYEELRDAVLGNLRFVGITELTNAAGTLSARMEYPIRTSNILAPKGLWQLDAGPVLFPDFVRPTRMMVELFARAYIVMNSFSWAEIVVHQPAPIMKDGKQIAIAGNYHAPVRIPAESRVVVIS